jgi:hypothetical protein
MKFLVVLALFALAAAEPEAEADPYYYYNGHYNGYTGYPHTYGLHHPFVGAYAHYPYYHVPAVAKAKEVKVEEPVVAKEVKPAVYTVPQVYGYPHHYQYPAVTYAKPYTYYANSVGAVHIVKREAEAEPTAEADPNAWYGYGYGYGHGYGYGYGHYPYTYGRSAYYHHPYTYGYNPYRAGYYYGK